MQQTPPIPPPVRTIGRYALHSEIATGGMATVFVGRALGAVGFSRTVAIKRLHPHYARDPEFVSMFCDEARLAARIHHPNVVATLDVVATDGELFLVMDYVQGESLSRVLRALRAKSERLPPRIAVSIVSGLLYGLHAAHEATNELGEPLQIVHRDISPQNVLVGTDGVARVLDFGVAKAAGRVQETHGSMMKGKVPYMAPEQIRGDKIDRRTDIFSASVVLWEVLVGRRLFEGDNDAQIISKIVDRPYPNPRSVVPTIPPAFDAIVMRGLSKEPSERFATASEMALALEKAMPPSTPREVGEFVSRVASDALLQRNRIVAEMESIASGRAVVPHPAPPLAASAYDPASAASLDPSSASRRIQGSGVSHPSRVEAHAPSPAPGVSAQGLGLVIASSVIAALLVVVGLMLVLVVRPRLREPVDQTPSARTATVQPPVVAPPVASPAPPLETTASAEPSASSVPPATASTRPAAPAVSATVARPPAATATTSKPPAKASCDPPYTVDARGVRHYKPECL